MDPEFPQVLSCGIPGRVVAGLGVLSRLGYAGLYVGSIGFDCLHKEGLSLHLCNVVIPVRLPLWGLSQMGWRWAWVFACFPVGLLAGEWLYTFLDAISTWRRRDPVAGGGRRPWFGVWSTTSSPCGAIESGYQAVNGPAMVAP